MPNAIKEKFISDLTEELKGSEHVIVTDYQGLNSEEFNELRAKLRTVGAKYKVVKNRLARLALKNVGWDKLMGDMKGPSALAYKGSDSAALARVLKDFGTDHKNLKIKAGQLYGMAANAEEVKIIANLPSRNVLLSTLLVRLNSPLQSLVMTLQEPIRSFNAALSAVAKKKEAASAS
jgi:large subunit ribosomal protein L10